MSGEARRARRGGGPWSTARRLYVVLPRVARDLHPSPYLLHTTSSCHGTPLASFGHQASRPSLVAEQWGTIHTVLIPVTFRPRRARAHIPSYMNLPGVSLSRRLAAARQGSRAATAHPQAAPAAHPRHPPRRRSPPRAAYIPHREFVASTVPPPCVHPCWPTDRRWAARRCGPKRTRES